jgi:dTDP-4-dehydrorhamnose reductase
VRILVTGAAGMLGRDLSQDLGVAGAQITTLTRAELDLTDPGACVRAVEGHDVVVNSAAWTAVDAAEEHEAEAFAVNATGVANIARACDIAAARLVHVSSDYVFGGGVFGGGVFGGGVFGGGVSGGGDPAEGRARTPYSEIDPLAPASAYGRSKAAGEWAARALNQDTLVVRTAWLYGAHGRCFPRSIAAALAERPTLDVVSDQVGQPTWTRDVAELVRQLLAVEAPPGTYHATSSGQTSWHGFARAVAEAVGADPERVHETSSSAYSTARPSAPRPTYSVLGHHTLDQVGVEPIGPWRERWAVAAATVLQES